LRRSFPRVNAILPVKHKKPRPSATRTPTTTPTAIPAIAPLLRPELSGELVTIVPPVDGGNGEPSVEALRVDVLEVKPASDARLDDIGTTEYSVVLPKVEVVWTMPSEVIVVRKGIVVIGTLLAATSKPYTVVIKVDTVFGKVIGTIIVVTGVVALTPTAVT
jgi:hypothetical protein